MHERDEPLSDSAFFNVSSLHEGCQTQHYWMQSSMPTPARVCKTNNSADMGQIYIQLCSFNGGRTEAGVSGPNVNNSSVSMNKQ